MRCRTTRLLDHTQKLFRNGMLSILTSGDSNNHGQVRDNDAHPPRDTAATRPLSLTESVMGSSRRLVHDRKHPLFPRRV